jgi:hypothetical protein
MLRSQAYIKQIQITHRNPLVWGCSVDGRIEIHCIADVLRTAARTSHRLLLSSARPLVIDIAWNQQGQNIAAYPP